MKPTAIDADGHIVEKDKDIRSYLPEPHCNRRSTLLPSAGLDSSMGGRLGPLQDIDIPTQRRLQDMDKEGIDISVLFPTTSFHISQVIERDYAAAFARAYNDFIADVCKESPRLRGVGIVAFQDVRTAVEEVNRAITKLGLAGIGLASQGLKEHLGSQTFWPIYEELEHLNVPLLIHNGRMQPAGEIRCDSFTFVHTIGRPIETAIQFVGLMYAGVPERFPKLRIAFLECGVGWIPYWLERMDEEYEKRSPEVPLLKAKPSEYLKRRNWFFATEPEEAMLPYVTECVGEDVVVFASDYPHWDSLFPYVVSTIQNRKDISEVQKKKILGENAKRLYGWSS
jgi:uncharacterized protein